MWRKKFDVKDAEDFDVEYVEEIYENDEEKLNHEIYDDIFVYSLCFDCNCTELWWPFFKGWVLHFQLFVSRLFFFLLLGCYSYFELLQ